MFLENPHREDFFVSHYSFGMTPEKESVLGSDLLCWDEFHYIANVEAAHPTECSPTMNQFSSFKLESGLNSAMVKWEILHHTLFSMEMCWHKHRLTGCFRIAKNVLNKCSGKPLRQTPCLHIFTCKWALQQTFIHSKFQIYYRSSLFLKSIFIWLIFFFQGH